MKIVEKLAISHESSHVVWLSLRPYDLMSGYILHEDGNVFCFTAIYLDSRFTKNCCGQRIEGRGGNMILKAKYYISHI